MKMPGFQLEAPRCQTGWLIPGMDTDTYGQLTAGCPCHWARTGVQRWSSSRRPRKTLLHEIFRAKAWCNFYKQKVLRCHWAVQGFRLLWLMHLRSFSILFTGKPFPHPSSTPLSHQQESQVGGPACFRVHVWERHSRFLNYKGFLFSPIKKKTKQNQ